MSRFTMASKKSAGTSVSTTSRPTAKHQSSTQKKAAGEGMSREEMIATAAYLRAERRGFVGGDPVTDWLAAEAEIDAKLKSMAGGSTIH